MKQRVIDRIKGFSFFEIILVLLILAITIVPIVGAFSPAILSTDTEEKMVLFSNYARGTMHRISALDYPTLNDNIGNPVDLVSLLGSAEEAAKETFIYKGDSYTPSVVIADYSGGAGGILEITVALEEISLKTLKADY